MSSPVRLEAGGAGGRSGGAVSGAANRICSRTAYTGAARATDRVRAWAGRRLQPPFVNARKAVEETGATAGGRGRVQWLCFSRSV